MNCVYLRQYWGCVEYFYSFSKCVTSRLWNCPCLFVGGICTVGLVILQKSTQFFLKSRLWHFKLNFRGARIQTLA